jgi:5'-3' exonuclease
MIRGDSSDGLPGIRGIGEKGAASIANIFSSLPEVVLATKEDDHGRFEIDRIYYSHREDPRKAARLALFLLDEQEYINQVTREAVRSTKLNTAKKLKIVTGSSKSNSGPVIKDNVNKFGGDGLIPLETIAGAK